MLTTKQIFIHHIGGKICSLKTPAHDINLINILNFYCKLFQFTLYKWDIHLTTQN